MKLIKMSDSSVWNIQHDPYRDTYHISIAVDGRVNKFEFNYSDLDELLNKITEEMNGE